MLRISRLTDYGIVLLAHLAGERDGTTHNARELAQRASLPLPAVSKILKTLTHERIARLSPRRQGRLWIGAGCLRDLGGRAHRVHAGSGTLRPGDHLHDAPPVAAHQSGDP